MDRAWAVRQAVPADLGSLKRLIGSASRVMLRFHLDSLADYLALEPFLLAEEAGWITGFQAWVVRQPRQASLGAAGLADDVGVSCWLEHLLPPSIARLREAGAAALSYTGSADWLLESLQEHGFHLISRIVTFEKTGWSIPQPGNQVANVRHVRSSDLPAVVELDAQSFHPRWRNSLESLEHWKRSLPYFAVATVAETVMGYCYCSTSDPGHGQLIRIAVHPLWQGKGMGSRLMAEAIRFFQAAGVRHITLNTQEENERAQQMYRRFGFRMVGQEATALWREL